MIPIFTLTTRGLEAITAREMGDLPGINILETGYRRVAATEDGNPALLDLRTADDVFIDVATWRGIERPRSTLALITELSTELDLQSALAICAQVRRVPQNSVFSVTASFVGKRNYSADEIKLACAEGITQAHHWQYTPDDAQADLNVRVFIEHETAYIGVRFGKKPLQDRAYKQVNLPGSTKPPVAAAMVMLGEMQPGMRLLDPCCGAGTILAEGALMGATVIGGDHDPEAVKATRTNLRTAGISARIERWDASALPLEDSSVDRIVSNLPWGRQVETKDDLSEFYRRACHEIRRVLAPGGKIVLLSGTPELLGFPDLQLEQQFEISLFGQNPTISVFAAK